jgi:hypothetical protein
MAENITNQCLTKFYVARNMYLEDLSSTEQNNFKTGTDALIVNARTRYEAWGRHLNENPYANSKASSYMPIATITEDNILIITTLIISPIFAIGGFIIIKTIKKKQK